MDFFRNLISTTWGKFVVVGAVLLVLYIIVNHQDPRGARGNDIAKVAEHAVVYQGVRQGMNALFKSHGEREHHEYHREYREHREA